MSHLFEDLQAQTFTNFEAILVNDGDDSQIEIMEQIAAQDSRIKIVRLKKNSGVAAARNAGTDTAQAPWVGYADPDDRFGPHYLQSLYEPVEKLGGVELVCGGFANHYVRTGKTTTNLLNRPPMMDMAEAYEAMSHAFCHGLVWNKLYNRRMISDNGLRFREEMLVNEDEAFNLEYYWLASNVGMVSNCEYVYYIYDGDTLCHRYDPRYMENAYTLVNLRERLRHKLGWPQQLIAEKRRKELTYDSFRMCISLFSTSSPLTFGGAVAKIRADILDNAETVGAILQDTHPRDRMIHLHQRLVRMGNARLMALAFKLLTVGKSRFGNIYAKVKPYFRGK